MGETQDVVVIGGGPGGYVAAIHGARLGGKITLVEKADLGGTCLNRGCIPTKALLNTADVLSQVREAKAFGINFPEFTFDLAQAVSRKDAVVHQLRSGVESLLQRNGVRVVKGTADILAPGQVRVAGEKEEILTTKNIIAATGSKPSALPLQGTVPGMVMDTDQAVNLQVVPASMLIAGGGYIGVEFADVYQRFGSQVTIVEPLGRLLPAEDAELGQAMQRGFEKRGIRVLAGSVVKQVRMEENEKLVTVVTGDREEKVRVTTVLNCSERLPNTQGLGLERAGVHTEQARIVTDERMQTNVPGIYAIGDVVGRTMLAHAASREGMVAVENALGRQSRMDYRAVPRCIYTRPQVAAVGLTEEQAKEKGCEITIGRFPLAASGRALTLGEREGFVKVIAGVRYGEILGVGIVGPQATEQIAEAVLAIGVEAIVEDLARAIHAHPTLSEASMEAALDALGQAIHIPPRRVRPAAR